MPAYLEPNDLRSLSQTPATKCLVAEGSTMLEPRGSFSIVVTVAPEQRRADLILSGDIDVSATPVLADAVDQVAAAAPHVTVVDLAAITFAGSVLLDFLARVHQALPAGSGLVVCRPTPAIRRILEIAAMEQLAASAATPSGGSSTSGWAWA